MASIVAPTVQAPRSSRRRVAWRSAARGALAAALLAGGSLLQAGRAQSPADAVYERRCLQCHGPAPDFASSELAVRDNVLVGRNNGLPVADLLTRHGRTLADEIAPLVERLRTLLEAAKPAPKS